MGRAEKITLLFLLILFIVPLIVGNFEASGYIIRVLTMALFLSSLALAQNIVLGYTGYPAFGSIAFFGTGGYITGILMKEFNIPFALSLLTGAVFSFIFALLIAPPLMRLKSHYFAITTLALQIALSEMVANLEITGGVDGINLPIYRGFLENYLFYYLFLTLVLFSFLINLLIDKSVYGYAFKAIREDEIAAESLGVNTVLIKSLAFGLTALISALAGGIYAYWITYIDPVSMFDPLLSVKMFVAVLLGGVGNPWGPITGSFALEILSEIVWAKFLELHGVILGILIVLIVLFKGFRK